MRIFKPLVLILVAAFLILISFAASAFAGGIDERTETRIVYDFIRLKNPGQQAELTYDVAYNTVLASREFGVPIDLIVGIQRPESDFNVLAVSRKDARGPMQIHYPTWGPKMGIPSGKKWLLHVPSINIAAGVRIFKYYYDLDGSVVKALYSYLGLPDEKLDHMSPEKRRESQIERLQYATKVIRAALEYRRFAAMALDSDVGLASR